jgi:DHA1 family multidrug resistance protein-like MFS transporter
MKKYLTIRKLLYATALLAVLADSMLIPFYPQFFEKVYQEQSLLITGVFIAVCRLAMIVSFPFWSWLTRRIEPLKILSWTQGAAGMLCILCSFASTLSYFFIFTILIELLKSSYLLIYPYLVKTAGKDDRAAAISGISIILNLGIVISTLMGGYFLAYLEPRYILIVVGLLDILQMLISRYILAKNLAEAEGKEMIPLQEEQQFSGMRDFLLLCLITLLFYFAMVIIRPYYTLFLIDTYQGISMTGAALIFIIPNMVALFIAPFIAKLTSSYPLQRLLLVSCGLMMIGIGMQVFPAFSSVLITGRFLYGIGMFICEVIIDMMIFNLSSDKNIYKYYSYVNVVQSVSVLLAPLAAASLVSQYGQYPLFISALVTTGAMIGIALLLSVYRKKEIALIKTN